MPGIPSLSSFFNDISRPNNKKHLDDFHKICFVLVNDFHWNYYDIMETPIPFIFSMLESRNDMIKEQERLSKKK